MEQVLTGDQMTAQEAEKAGKSALADPRGHRQHVPPPLPPHPQPRAPILSF